MIKATVTGLIVKMEENSEKILLTQRKVHPFFDYWALPGGHIEEGEKAIDAVKREVREETGLDFKPEFFTYNDEIFQAYGFYAVVIVFTGRATGHIKIQEEEVSDCGWYTVSEALKLKLAFNHEEIIQSYAERKKINY
jgi:8-oxo-dGTP diphosphatase